MPQRVKPFTFAPAALAAVAALSPCLYAIEPVRMAGGLNGRVMNAAGAPQMGATVILYNRFERVVGRALTNERGAFSFDGILPDIYSVRVTLASFVPAFKRNIAVQPGNRTFLAINLTSLLSSIELVYLSGGPANIISEDWKWVLRSAGSTRPVLRLLPGVDISDPRSAGRANPVFSKTRGLVRVSSGEAGDLSHAGSLADLGTAFALATSVFGSNQVSVSGNFGYASNSGTPTAGFRTSFSRDFGGASSPEVNVTMRQVFLPARIGAMLAAGRVDNTPALQTLAMTLVDRRKLGDGLELDYGASLESVSFLTRLNYASPFARLRWGSVDEGSLEFAFSSGAAPTEIMPGGEPGEAELQHDLVALSLFPRVSLRGGRALVQRTQNYEIGYRRQWGSRTFAASAYREATTNAAFNAQADPGAITSPDLLPDLASKTSVINGGDFRRMGYVVSLTQNIGDALSATVAYSRSGALELAQAGLTGSNAEELRRALALSGRSFVTARLAGTLPTAGTKFAASYQFSGYDALQPVHISLVQRSTLEPGMNLYLRQPIPRLGSVLPGRLEASAELRNLLAQGYLPVGTPGGQRLILVQSPRAVRGGLSLIF